MYSFSFLSAVVFFAILLAAKILHRTTDKRIFRKKTGNTLLRRTLDFYAESQIFHAEAPMFGTTPWSSIVSCQALDAHTG